MKVWPVRVRSFSICYSLPLPLGEGLLQNETFIDLFFGRVSQQKEKRSGQAPALQLSPHPDPLPKGEGILRRAQFAAQSNDQYSSSNSSFSGFCLCLALRPAGRAFGSGLASVSGCPGGASGPRIELIIDLPVRFRRFRGHSLRFRNSTRSWARSPRRNDTDSG